MSSLVRRIQRQLHPSKKIHTTKLPDESLLEDDEGNII